MKKIIIILFFLIFSTSFVLAATVGGPEMSVPEDSLFLKEQAIKDALDRFQEELNLKVGLDIEIITKRKLSSAPADVSGAEIKGHNFIFKISNNYKNIIEPYIKIGTSRLEVSWDQHGNDIEVDSDIGFVWGAGMKAKLWELKDHGVNLTMDLQYRHSNMGFDSAKIGGSTSTASRQNEDFTIDEWQTSFLASKKFIIPLGAKEHYIIPYGGLTYLASDVDVSFTQSTSGLLYSTYNADDKNDLGIVLGCDIMPFYLSYYLLNFELRLLNETALTLGGTVKF